jgi:hypothetical protein
VPFEDLSAVLAEDMVNEETGEIYVEAGDELIDDKSCSRR